MNGTRKNRFFWTRNSEAKTKSSKTLLGLSPGKAVEFRDNFVLIFKDMYLMIRPVICFGETKCSSEEFFVFPRSNTMGAFIVSI
jgi:hypothetical protein